MDARPASWLRPGASVTGNSEEEMVRHQTCAASRTVQLAGGLEALILFTPRFSPQEQARQTSG